MSETAPTSASLPTLDRDIPCLQCQYNLRGLDARGKCPECGQDIGPSLAAWLEQFDPRKGRLLAKGALLAAFMFPVRSLTAGAWGIAAFYRSDSPIVEIGAFHWQFYAGLILVECIAFYRISRMRRQVVRLAVPLGAALAIVVLFATRNAFVPDALVENLLIAEGISFAVVSLLSLRDALAIAKMIKEIWMVTWIGILSLCVPCVTIASVARFLLLILRIRLLHEYPITLIAVTSATLSILGMTSAAYCLNLWRLLKRRLRALEDRSRPVPAA